MSTSAVFEYERDAIRVKARFYTKSKENNEEIRKFSVDPNLTSYDTLRNLLSRAFDLKDDLNETFRISYYCANEWLPMLSDWDLDAAVISASDPCLQLALIFASQRDKVTLQGFEQQQHQPRISSDSSISPTTAAAASSSSSNAQQDSTALQQLVISSKSNGANFLKSTLPALTTKLQRMVTMPSEDHVQTHQPVNNSRAPLSDKEFRSFLDNVGELVRPRELRLVVYRGGVEPQLRKVVWKHLLGVYPQGLDGRRRLDYMRNKSLEYNKLKTAWLDIIANGKVTDEIKLITNMVRKDVLRTDRQHKFYSGETNENITALYNILTTYALHYPSVGYCQGMSDLLSPILMIMQDEAQGYVCFCALMKRLKKNFLVDGVAMTKMFQHLSEGLTYYDPEFFAYLKINQADDLLFCYRWLLLEMKREFAFEDSLQVLETLWASLPPVYAEREGLQLFEIKLKPEVKKASEAGTGSSSTSTGTPRKETVYAKMVSLRRRTTSGDLKKIFVKPLSIGKSSAASERPRVQSESGIATSTSGGLDPSADKKQSSDGGGGGQKKSSTLKITDLKDFNKLSPTSATAASISGTSPVSNSSSVNSIPKEVSPDDPFDNIGYLNGSGQLNNSGTHPSNNNTTTSIICERLPEPTLFGDGNPFLMFICIACLLQHRNQIMNGRYDYQEIAMYFDKLVRKHDVSKTLSLARKLFAEYLNDDWAMPANNIIQTEVKIENSKPSC